MLSYRSYTSNSRVSSRKLVHQSLLVLQAVLFLQFLFLNYYYYLLLLFFVCCLVLSSKNRKIGLSLTGNPAKNNFHKNFYFLESNKLAKFHSSSPKTVEKLERRGGVSFSGSIDPYVHKVLSRALIKDIGKY